MKPKRKVLLIGLDCCEPRFLFDLWKGELPNISAMMEQGIFGPIKSTTPCITIPAWSCMFSGKDPGELGIYGFKNRAAYNYRSAFIPDSTTVRHPRIWEILGARGLQSIVVGVPQTFPVKPMNGHLVSGLLTPTAYSQFTYPAHLKMEINEWLESEDYQFDIDNFRNLSRADLFAKIDEMTRQQMLVFQRLIQTKNWDFATLMLIGTDRINHGFWDFIDPEHPNYIPGNLYEKKILNYYKLIDQKIGEMVREVPKNTAVMIVSDHGAKRMKGGVCINQWLISQGWLTLKNPEVSQQIQRLRMEDIDWERTRVWGEGGYCGRLWINKQGREKKGIVSADEYPIFRNELRAAIENMDGPDGLPLNNSCFYPEDIYQEVNRIAPDLLVYFGDLHWRSIGSIGHSSFFTTKNDTGVDGANHSTEGIFVLYQQGKKWQGQLSDQASILNVKDTILQLITTEGQNTGVGILQFQDDNLITTMP